MPRHHLPRSPYDEKDNTVLKNKKWTNIKLIGTIVPIVVAMILIVLFLARSEVIRLSQDKLALESRNYAEDISKWAAQVLSELDIYRVMVEKMGLEDAQVFEMMETSYDTHEAYPYGLYMGDENGFYFDASGWVPGDDFVVKERDWYLEGLHHDVFAFGEPYVDVMTGDTCVSATARLDNASVTTVLAADVYLDYASQLVREITQGSIDKAMFITQESRAILADSDAAMIGMALDNQENSLLYRNINGLLDQDMTGQSTIKGDDGVYLVDINRIEDTDWFFVTCMSQERILSRINQLEALMLLVALVAALLLSIVTNKVAREMGEIRNQAKMDTLTGIFNREGFRDLMGLALQSSSKQGILMIVDLDNFKLVNDELGHPTGDQVLKDFAALLDGFFNMNKDIVARIGGDEFAVYIGRAVTRKEVEEQLGKLIQLIHQKFDGEYPEQHLSASIGAAFTADNGNYHELYQSADKALYEVKRKGKDDFLIL